jgi:hypothetical protein
MSITGKSDTGSLVLIVFDHTIYHTVQKCPSSARRNCGKTRFCCRNYGNLHRNCGNLYFCRNYGKQWEMSRRNYGKISVGIVGPYQLMSPAYHHSQRIVMLQQCSGIGKSSSIVGVDHENLWGRIAELCFRFFSALNF